MSDLVKQLREMHAVTAAEAATEIERLRAENARLRRLIAECQSDYPGRCAAWEAIFAKTAKEAKSLPE